MSRAAPRRAGPGSAYRPATASRGPAASRDRERAGFVRGGRRRRYARPTGQARSGPARPGPDDVAESGVPLPRTTSHIPEARALGLGQQPSWPGAAQASTRRRAGDSDDALDQPKSGPHRCAGRSDPAQQDNEKIRTREARKFGVTDSESPTPSLRLLTSLASAALFLKMVRPSPCTWLRRGVRAGYAGRILGPDTRAGYAGRIHGPDTRAGYAGRILGPDTRAGPKRWRPSLTPNFEIENTQFRD